MRLTIESFAGLAPKVSPVKLGDALATIADTVRLDRGRIDPWKGLLPIGKSAPTGSESIYPYNNGWLAWQGDVDVVGKITPNDVRERIVYTDDEYPKIRSGSKEYRLGIPRPSAANAEVVKAGDKSQLTYVRNQSYRISFVDAWGAEGPLSDPTVTLEVGTGSEVKVIMPAVPVGNYNFGDGARKRIYRSNTGSDTSIWQFVDEVPIATGEYRDKKEAGELQEQAISENWIGPPDDNTALYPAGPLQGLCALPNGSLCGFTGNVVCLSEPFVPAAWPLEYRVTIPDGIVVAVIPLTTGVFVATDKKPYLIQGTSHAVMTPIPIESQQSCVSKRSAVDMGGYGIFASPDGLVIADGSGATLATSTFFSKHEWSVFEPDTIQAWQYEGKYIATYGSGDKGFIFDPAGDLATFTTFTLPASAGHFSVKDDTLYLLNSAGQITQFDAGSPLSFVWQSKIFMLPEKAGLSVLRVEAEKYPVTVTVFADGKQRLRKEIKSGSPVRLPSGFRAKKWQVKIEGVNPVEFIMLADSMMEVV